MCDFLFFFPRNCMGNYLCARKTPDACGYKLSCRPFLSCDATQTQVLLLAHTDAAHSAANGIYIYSFCTTVVVGGDDGGGPGVRKLDCACGGLVGAPSFMEQGPRELADRDDRRQVVGRRPSGTWNYSFAPSAGIPLPPIKNRLVNY